MRGETVLQVATTTDSQELAETIARKLVDDRLAACVQIAGPIVSVYRWQGQVETATEWTCTVKTTGENLASVEAAIRASHSYDEPEFIATEIVVGSDTYLDWVRQECRQGA